MKSTIENILKDYKQGKMIILMDDEQRENEGDLLMSAGKISAGDINFMATYGRGLICLTLTKKRCEKLNLPLMVSKNKIQNSTNFTLSIEAANGVSTGISAADRAHTIQVAVAKNATADDIVMPGHIFPLMAKEGGVLTRAGHTEAGCDLARLAGFEPASVIVEVLNTNGTMARYDDLVQFSKKHQIKLGTITDLIRYRTQHEKTITKLSTTIFHSKHGDFKLIAFAESIHNDLHLALIKGEIYPKKETLVRVHMEDTLSDVLREKREKINIDTALSVIGKSKQGILLLLRKQNNDSLLNKISYRHKNISNLNVENAEDDIKTYGVGAQILNELGVCKMRILGSVRKLHALKGFNLEVVGYEEY